MPEGAALSDDDAGAEFLGVPYTCSMVGTSARSFLLIAFGISWGVAGVGALFGVDTAHPAYTAVAAICMLGPAIAALVQWRLIDRVSWSTVGLHPARIRWPGLLATVLVGVCIVPLTLAVAHLFGDGSAVEAFGHVEVSGTRFAERVAVIMSEQGLATPGRVAERLAGLPGVGILLALLAVAVVAAFTINLPFMLGEELGWRGYLFGALRSWPPIRRVSFTGAVWGAWHAPLIAMGHNYPGHPVAGIFQMVLFCVLLAVLFDHARWRASSVWAPCVLHGIINGSAGAYLLFAEGGHVLVASPAGIAGCIAIALLATVVFLLDGAYRRAFLHPAAPQT